MAAKSYPGGPPMHWIIFLQKPCWRCGGVRKSRGQGLGGPLQREAKAALLKLRCAKLEAPLRGAMRDLTTARPEGRQILTLFIDTNMCSSATSAWQLSDFAFRGSLWFVFGSCWSGSGSFRFAFASFWLVFGSLLVRFGSLLARWGA